MILWGLASLALAGELSGKLLTPDHDPVVGATVVAYDPRLNYVTALTDAQGIYRFTELGPFPRRLRVLPARADNVVEQYLPEGIAICSAEPIAVQPGELIDVGATVLRWGGEIEGFVQDADGNPVVGAQVGARPMQGEPQFGARYSATDSQGAFLIRGVPPGFLHKLDISAVGWPRQLASGVYLEDGARVYQVAEQGRYSAGTLTLLDGVAISGSADGPHGPIESGEIQASAPGQTLNAPIVDGQFEVQGLPPGDVLLKATAPGLAQTWYPDRDRPGPRLHLTEGEHLDQVHLQLPQAGHLTGRVVADVELRNLSVIAYNDDQSLGFGGSVDEDGEFEVRGLYPGVYSVQLLGSSAGLLDTFLLDAHGGPLQFEVPEGAGVDLGEHRMARAARVEGTVQDLYDGSPIYGAQIYAQPIDRDTGYVTSSRPDGTYRFPGLSPGVWRMWVEYQAWCPDDLDHAARFYPDQVNRLFIGSVTLRGGQQVEWNPQLPPDRDHDKMDDVWEQAHGLDPERDDADEDPDGDGYTNYQEYLLGTDPTSADEGPPCTCQDGRAALWFGPGLGVWLLARRRREADRP